MQTLVTAPRTAKGPHFISHRAPKVLCIDDDPEVSWAIEARLRAYNVEVRRTFHGMQGIGQAVDSQPDLIILDLSMPGGDGAYVAENLRNNTHTAAIPIIVLTGSRDSDLQQKTLHLGVDSFLRKPIAFDELKEHIARFIDLRRRSEWPNEDSAE